MERKIRTDVLTRVVGPVFRELVAIKTVNEQTALFTAARNNAELSTADAFGLRRLGSPNGPRRYIIYVIGI